LGVVAAMFANVWKGQIRKRWIGRKKVVNEIAGGAESLMMLVVVV
jgi:hypothetical protein